MYPLCHVFGGQMTTHGISAYLSIMFPVKIIREHRGSGLQLRNEASREEFLLRETHTAIKSFVCCSSCQSIVFETHQTKP